MTNWRFFAILSPGFHNRRLEKTKTGDMGNPPSDGGASVQQYDAEGFLKICLARAGGLRKLSGQSVECGTLNTAKYYWNTSANIATAGIYDQAMTKGDISVEEDSTRVGVLLVLSHAP